MQAKIKLSFFILLLMISFASVNAVLFTPALPSIAAFFSISNATAEQTIIWFLIGYTIGQLVYGPLANRFGRKPALYMGISLQIISSFICIAAGFIHAYSLLVIGRFLLALGSGVGLKMTFTLVNECYEPKIASQKISYLMLAFAITPGLAVALGGILNQHFNWMSCFYAGAAYGFLLLLLVTRLPETQKVLHRDAFKFTHLMHGYSTPFKNSRLVAGGLLMGGSTSFVYVFAALAPFLAINLLGMNSAQYGIANVLPPLGLIVGMLSSAQLAKKYALRSLIRVGILIASMGVLLMLLAVGLHLTALFSLFLPMIVIYFGLSLVLGNASTIAMSQINDKAHASAVMNFINMGSATLMVLMLGFFSVNTFLLPGIYIVLCTAMIGIYRWQLGSSLEL